MLRNGSDLGERALLRTVQVDAVSECLTDVLRRDAEQRSSAGRAVVDRLDQVAAHSAVLGHAIETGRERVIDTITRGQEATQCEAVLAATCKKQLDECVVFVTQAAGAAAQARDGIRSKLRADAVELTGLGVGVDAARAEIESALVENCEANRLIEQSGKQILVSAFHTTSQFYHSSSCPQFICAVQSTKFPVFKK
jgi:hypothetical protein